MVTVEAAAVEGGGGHSSCFYHIDVTLDNIVTTAGQVLGVGFIMTRIFGLEEIISKSKYVYTIFRARRRSLLLFSRDFEQTIINQSISPKDRGSSKLLPPRLGEDH